MVDVANVLPARGLRSAAVIIGSVKQLLARYFGGAGAGQPVEDPNVVWNFVIREHSRTCWRGSSRLILADEPYSIAA